MESVGLWFSSYTFSYNMSNSHHRKKHNIDFPDGDW
jgi:hypothetical protein